MTDEKCEKSLRPNDCDVVTFQNGENALARDEIGVVETVKDLSIPGFLLREAHRCEQCHGTADGTEQLTPYAHRECARFWHHNGARMNRRPASITQAGAARASRHKASRRGWTA